MAVRMEDIEAPMVYVNDGNPEFTLLVLEVTKYPSAVKGQSAMQVTWRWITNPNIGEDLIDTAGNNALNRVYTTYYEFGEYWPYKPLPYVVEEFPS